MDFQSPVEWCPAARRARAEQRAAFAFLAETCLWLVLAVGLALAAILGA